MASGKEGTGDGQYPFQNAFEKASLVRRGNEATLTEEDGRPRPPDGLVENMKTNSSFIAFTMVIFENFFAFLMGFFIGSGLTLIFAVYIVAATYKKCHPDTIGGNTPGENTTPDKETEKSNHCMSLFFTFIATFSAIIILICLYVGIRTCFKSQQHKETKNAKFGKPVSKVPGKTNKTSKTPKTAKTSKTPKTAKTFSAKSTFTK